MNEKLASRLIKGFAALGLIAITVPAFAHVSAMHSASGFQMGFMHPLTGLDHLLAMMAVGVWAALHKRPAVWLLPVVFPAMMVIGALLGVSGMVIPGVEAGIAASVLILGLMIAFSMKVPVPFSACMVAVFAVAHGYAHGVELPAGEAALSFGLGFLLSTAMLHLAGLVGTIYLNQLRNGRLIRIAGAVIAAFGLYFVSAVV